MLKRLLVILCACVALALPIACDVDKQMDTMVDNPSFAAPLFGKFMSRTEYQVKAIDTILADPAMRQVLLDAAASGSPQLLEPEWVFRCNRFFWERIDRGERDYGRMVDDFRSLVNGRC